MDNDCNRLCKVKEVLCDPVCCSISGRVVFGKRVLEGTITIARFPWLPGIVVRNAFIDIDESDMSGMLTRAVRCFLQC